MPRVVDLANPQGIEKHLISELAKQTGESKIAQVGVETQSKQTVEKAVAKTVTDAETQRMLETYTRTFQRETNPTLAADTVAQRVDVRMHYAPEVKANLEQSVRLMHAYEAVMDVGAYPDDHLKIEKAVLKALNESLQKTNLFVEPRVEPTAHVEKAVRPQVQVQEAEVIETQTATQSPKATQTIEEMNQDTMRATAQGLDVTTIQATLSAQQQAQAYQQAMKKKLRRNMRKRKKKF